MLINDAVANDGKVKRKVLALYLQNIGHGTYGLYSCKQTINNVVEETHLYIQPAQEGEAKWI